VIANAWRALNACQKWSATTATPPEVVSTLRTPGIFSAALESSVFNLPPSTGLWANAAYSIPGSLTSNPNSALPSTLPGESVRARDFPMIRKSLLDFNCTSLGNGSFAAESASSP
jgi:hypothetical protein